MRATEILERFVVRTEKLWGFRCRRRARYLPFVLVALAVALLYLAFRDHFMPYSAIVSTVLAASIILVLCADSLCFLFYLLYSSPKEVIPLARIIDPQISKAITIVEEIVITLNGEPSAITREIESQAKELTSDFETRPPYPRITAVLFGRTIMNFVLTIFCFALLSMSLIYFDNYCANVNSNEHIPIYGHDCSKIGCYGAALVHSFYYHTVVFQSLGDGQHGPRTIGAQAIVGTESFIAFLYLILIIGGVYSTATIVRDNMTPKLFRESLIVYLRVLCAKHRPILKEDMDLGERS